METVRKPCQGVWNIVRFNWPFYVIAYSLAAILWGAEHYFSPIVPNVTIAVSFAIIFMVHVSLMVSMYVYDISGLYTLNWLDGIKLVSNAAVININAGFDETSALLKEKYKEATLTALDFYDPKKHTEASIKRARKAYPPYIGTLRTKTTEIKLADESADIIFAILSAHEIRNTEERVLFFKELKRILKPKGQIVVTEHLRDVPNFMAYTIGFFHFHSEKTWLQTFKASKFKVSEEFKITPFITSFVLNHDTSS